MKKITKKTVKTAKTKSSKQLSNIVLYVVLSLLSISFLIGMTLVIYNSSYKFWNKDNEIRIIANFGEHVNSSDSKDNSDFKITEISDENLIEKIDNFKKGIYLFFKEEYGIDTSAELSQMSVYTFLDKNPSEYSILEGFYDIELLTVNLNSGIILNDSRLNYVFVHETIHFLGIIQEDSLSEFLMEGITEALTQQCLQHMGFEFCGTPFYEPQKKLAMQLLVVDKQIVVNLITKNNFNIMNYINEILQDVPRTALPSDDVAKYLALSANTIYYQLVYSEYQGDIRVFYFVAQDIVSSYCKEFNPTKKQISEIRKNYIVENFENMVVEKTETGYIVY